MDIQSKIQIILIWAVPVLFAITVHETAHGWVASKLGDKTAFMLGRITLNPIKHIDPIGTILVPLLLVWLGGFVFGWAKPVPVIARNLKNPKNDMALVAAAGPISNFIMCILWAIIAKISLIFSDVNIIKNFYYMGLAGISVNLVLAILNLIPIPPLDGSKVLSSFLSAKLDYLYLKIEPYGFFILLFLLYFKILGAIISIPFNFLYNYILTLFNL